jgi:hypothetical protein
VRESSFNIFERLGQDLPEESHLTRRDSDIDISGAFVAHALDADGLPVLLVPLQKNEPDYTDDESHGVHLSTHLIGEDGQARRYVLARCVDPLVRTQFELFADDIIRVLDRDSSAPGKACIDVLRSWRAMFRPSNDSRLTPAEQIGLIAELHLLENLARHDRERSLGLWKGPDRFRHDFVSSRCSIEVKATSARDQMVVKIHGEKQLDDPLDGPLYLYAEQLELAPGGDSLPALVNRILGLGVDAAYFLQSLEKQGYRLQDAESYAGFTYGVLYSKLCLVGDSFPRIIRRTFADEQMIDRFVRIEYVIDLGPIESQADGPHALSAAAEMLLL